MAKGQYEVIITVVLTVIIAIVGFFFLSSLFQTSVEKAALSDLKDLIDVSCQDGGPAVQSGSINLPANSKDYRILLTGDGRLELRDKDKNLIERVALKCPRDVAFAVAQFGPVSEGNENINVKISKSNKDPITNKVTLTAEVIK